MRIVDGKMEGREHKGYRQVYSQSKRRAEALTRLQESREKRKLANRQRFLSEQSEERWKQEETELMIQDFGQAMDISTEKQQKKDPVDERLTLMLPNWMIEFPEDLGRNWFVMCRPQGRRCMLIATKGRTVTKLKNGGILHSFKSKLPGGSAQRMGGPSILDCIFHELDNTYYVMDLLCWKGVQVLECEAEFRMAWIRQKLVECDEIDEEESFRIEPVAYSFCDERGLIKALYDYVPFTKDGIYLLHKDGHYIGGPTELAMLWKDLTCSTYLIETDMNGEPTESQHVLLFLGDDYGLYTGDNPPIKLTELSECVFDNHMIEDVPKPNNKLLKFKIHFLPENGKEISINPFNAAIQLEFLSFIRNRHKSADLMSKILFQKSAREGAIRSDELIRYLRYPPTQ